MKPPYEIEDVSQIYSPGLVIFRDLLVHNLQEMIRIAGGPNRLCPHCKTHKTREITKMQIELGIKSHKCATIAEAEMLCDVGVEDVFIAYQLVGPNVRRLIQLMDKFPQMKFATIVDNPDALEALSAAVNAGGHELDVLLDLDTGMGRTGIQIGPDAIELYEMTLSLPGIRPGGLHWYDGHNRQADYDDRKHAVDECWFRFTGFRDQVLLNGLPVPRVVTAGTGSFPILADKGEPNVQLSPGTTTLYDAQMAELFPEMDFKPALGILTRVISNNREGQLTLDVGHKSCAADQPAGKRLWFPDLPDAVELQQTEEHIVVQSELASSYQLGDCLIAIPTHACPTSAVHQFAHVVSAGRVVDRWEIASRDRVLTV